MGNPLVTVFMSVYNSEKYIKDSLESILNQTYENIEVLLVDDGSTDRTVDMIRTYKDGRIRLLQNWRNMGIPYTRNVGLREAKGEYMAIMDSDDIAEPHRIERQIRFLEKYPHIDVLGSFYIQFGGKFEKKVRSRFTDPEEIKAMLLFYNPIANPSAIIRLKTLKQHGLMYQSEFFVAQDYKLWADLSKVGNIALLPEFLLRYRFGHNNISKNSNEEKGNLRKHLIDSIHRDLLKFYKIPLQEEEIQLFNDFFTESYGGNIKNIGELVNVVEKVKKWNKENRIFNHEQFLKVLDFCILFAIHHQRLSFQQKVKLYRILTNNRKLADEASILAKHYYYRIRKIF